MEDDNSTEITALRNVIEKQRRALDRAKELLKVLPYGEKVLKEIEDLEQGNKNE